MSDDRQESEQMQSRIPGSRLKLWLLLGANRWLIAAGIVALTFVAVVVGGALDPVALEAAVSNSDPVETLFQGLLTAIITGVTLVVSINQVVLSQELGPVGDQRDRMEGAMAFRTDLDDAFESPTTPPDPAAFLKGLVDASARRAGDLRDAASNAPDDARSEIEDYVSRVRENASNVSDELDGAQFGTFDVVYSALDFNYSWKIYEGRRLQKEYDETLDDAAHAAFDELLDLLRVYGPAREHVKTLYFQWELVNLSRAMLYTGVPALIVAICFILFFEDTETVVGTTFGVQNLLLVVAGGAAVAVGPFAVLTSYILRIATVAKRTLAIGPFVLRDAAREDRGQ